MWIVSALAGGCNFHANGSGDGGAIDSAKDVPVDMVLPDVPSNCVGTGSLKICPTVEPEQDLTLVTQTIDTDSSPMCIAYTSQPTSDACVVVGHSIAIPGGATISAIGTHPLVLLSTTTLVLDGGGTIDASSPQPGPVVGAGGDSPLCTAGADGTGGGGGWGGSFGDKGGDGGSGLGTAGTAAAAEASPGFHGGCAGGVGTGGTPGLNGDGGGAVFLIAKTTIEIDGTINASGSGGTPGVTGSAGAGGGGSGGMIGIDGETVTIATGAAIFANGGGGGEGSGLSTLGAAGGVSTSPETAAVGGNGNSAIGGDGGAGSAGATTAGSVGAAGTGGGGGGGGGGAGVVRIYPAATVVPTNTVSPPAS